MDGWDVLQRRVYVITIRVLVFILFAASVAYAIDTWGIFHQLAPVTLIVEP